MEQLLLDAAFPPISEFPDLIKESSTKSNKAATPTGRFNGGISKPEKKTRSRAGCFSCKKLKIKCNEAKPICEYCNHTGRECAYPEAKPKAPRKRRARKSKKAQNEESSSSSSSLSDESTVEKELFSGLPLIPIDTDFVEIQSKPLQRLNSMSLQLEVSSFELKLLRFFLDFGASFFSFNVHEETYRFWSTEVPKLWCSSDLVKSSIYAISSVRLLANYELNNIETIDIEDEVDPLFGTVEIRTVNLLQKAREYIQNTSELAEQFKTLVLSNAINEDLSEILGYFAIAKSVLVAAKGVFPNSTKIDHPHPDPSGLYNMLSFVRGNYDVIALNVSHLKGTKFECILLPAEKQITTIDSEFVFIKYLRDYVDFVICDADILQFNYYTVISSVEIGAHRSLVFKYPVPFFRALLDFAVNDVFLNALNSKEHVAMKIMFYFCSLCSILDFKMFKNSSMWDDFVELYKVHSFGLFEGKFEDEMDENVYDCVVARRKSELPYDLQILRTLGKPLADFKNGKIELVPSEPEDVFF
ncbi:unnamed protein product [Wickerhamomyces anomalus]